MSTKTISEAQEVIQDNQDYTLFSWSKQKGASPIAVKYAEGVYLYDYDEVIEESGDQLFESPPEQLLTDALNLLGIPWDHV